MSEVTEIRKTTVGNTLKDRCVKKVEKLIEILDRDFIGVNLITHILYHSINKDHHYCEYVDRYEPGSEESCQSCDKKG